MYLSPTNRCEKQSGFSLKRVWISLVKILIGFWLLEPRLQRQDSINATLSTCWKSVLPECVSIFLIHFWFNLVWWGPLLFAKSQPAVIRLLFCPISYLLLSHLKLLFYYNFLTHPCLTDSEIFFANLSLTVIMEPDARTTGNDVTKWHHHWC